MQKLRSLIGLPILAVASGDRIGEVQEVILDFDQARVFGVVLTNATLFSPDEGILFVDLYGVGHDALTVSSRSVVKNLAALRSPGSCSLTQLCNKPVYSENGNYLGEVTDVVCAADTGEIRFYELSDGFITDIVQGRMLLPLPPAQVIHDERVIVPETMTKLLRAVQEVSGGG